MERRTLVIKLRTLRQEYEKDGANILDVAAPIALTLSDVCRGLELSQAEHDFVLGEEVAQAVEEWETARMWQPAEEKETATTPITELVAVPVA